MRRREIGIGTYLLIPVPLIPANIDDSLSTHRSEAVSYQISAQFRPMLHCLPSEGYLRKEKGDAFQRNASP